MIKPTISFQTGHENNPIGQTGTGGELDLVRKVFGALAPILTSKGIEVYYDDYTCSNIKRLGDGLNYMIALHFDGSTNASYNGGLIDVPPQCPNNKIKPCDMHADESWKFATKVADYYFNPMGIALRQEHRTKDTTYYEAFKFTAENTKQFIIELGTLTNQSDRAKLQDYRKIATLLAQGIIAYMEKYDTNYQAGTPTPPPVNCEAQIKVIRDQLEEQKTRYTRLQLDTSKRLADKDLECQQKISRLKQYVVSFINNYKE